MSDEEGNDVALAETEQRFAGWGEVLMQWAGVLVAPCVWALQMELSYLLVQPACQAGRNLSLHVVTVGALLLAAGGGLLAWRNWRQAGARWQAEAGDAVARSRFMGLLGLLLSAMFCLAILAQGIPSFVLHPCQP
ncbi:MAG TPA: hypothetical protein VF546_24475 [Pyrinomonadaceae bacterium]